MKWLESNTTWLLAIAVFLLTSFVETLLETTSTIHDVMFVIIATIVWLTSSIVCTYGLKLNVGNVDKYKTDDEIKYIDKPILLIFLSIASIIIMTTFMIMD